MENWANPSCATTLPRIGYSITLGNGAPKHPIFQSSLRHGIFKVKGITLKIYTDINHTTLNIPPVDPRWHYCTLQSIYNILYA